MRLLLFRPSVTKPRHIKQTSEATKEWLCRLLVRHMMQPDLAGRVNVFTHDYVCHKVCLAIVNMVLEHPPNFLKAPLPDVQEDSHDDEDDFTVIAQSTQDSL